MTVIIANGEEEESDQNNGPHMLNTHFVSAIVNDLFVSFISFAQPISLQGKHGIVFR